MISIIEQRNLLIEIGNKLSKEMSVYAIGGTAMMFLGFKEATVDIDVVFNTEQERKLFKEVAKSLGYTEMDAIIVYGVKNNKPEMINLGTSRLDLFVSDVIDFTFSEKMKERATAIHQFGKNLILKIADKHDIILMKCATRRAKDEDDIVNIVKVSEIDWNLITEETKLQVKHGRELAFVELGFLVEKLMTKHKIVIPKEIHKTLLTLLTEQMKLKSEK